MIDPYGFFTVSVDPVKVHLIAAVSAKCPPDRLLTVDALVLPSTDGTIHFQVLSDEPGVPKLFKFDFELKIRAVKIGDLRLFGRAPAPTWCLLVLTYDECAFLFHDFVFEVNTQHLSFRKCMQLAGKRRKLRN